MIDAIGVQLNTNLAPVVVLVKLGKRHLSDQRSPPSIVFWSMGGSIGPSDHSGTNPPQHGTRLLRVHANVWAASDPAELDEDYAACERLYNALVTAVRQVMVGSVKVLSESPPAGDDQQAAKGEQIVVVFEMKIPLVGAEMPTVQHVTLELTPP